MAASLMEGPALDCWVSIQHIWFLLSWSHSCPLITPADRSFMGMLEAALVSELQQHNRSSLCLGPNFLEQVLGNFVLE